MGNLWLKVKVWTKVVIAALIVVYLLIFVIKNNDQHATFWYWYNRSYQGSLLSLVFFAFLIGGLVAMLATTTFRTIRQIRELRARSRSSKLEAEVADMRAKAAMLQTRPSSSTTPISAPPASPSPGVVDEEDRRPTA
jgi:uncharacterized integral membrane protein